MMSSDSEATDAPYRSDRNENWLKLKCIQADKFIIVGYEPASVGPGLGALRVATKDMEYAGKVGTGFTGKVSLSLRRELDRFGIAKAPIKALRKKTPDGPSPSSSPRWLTATSLATGCCAMRASRGSHEAGAFQRIVAGHA
jgi:ATP-dependent DNA ligase